MRSVAVDMNRMMHLWYRSLTDMITRHQEESAKWYERKIEAAMEVEARRKERTTALTRARERHAFCSDMNRKVRAEVEKCVAQRDNVYETILVFETLLAMEGSPAYGDFIEARFKVWGSHVDVLFGRVGW